jgi:hypothetical protein
MTVSFLGLLLFGSYSHQQARNCILGFCSASSGNESSQYRKCISLPDRHSYFFVPPLEDVVMPNRGCDQFRQLAAVANRPLFKERRGSSVLVKDAARELRMRMVQTPSSV